MPPGVSIEAGAPVQVPPDGNEMDGLFKHGSISTPALAVHWAFSDPADAAEIKSDMSTILSKSNRAIYLA